MTAEFLDLHISSMPEVNGLSHSNERSNNIFEASSYVVSTCFNDRLV